MDLSIVRKILIDCFKFDRISYAPARVLTTAHDNDRSLLYEGKFYSPLISTIEDDLADRGVDCVSIARIISRIKGPLAHGRVYSPEGRFARALVVKRAFGLVVRREYPFSRMEEKTWGAVLDATGARRVLGIQPSRELCRACHRRGVWVADVQHGVIAEGHTWYGEKFRAQEPGEYLPDAFLLWDQGSAEVLRWTGAKGIAAKVIGNRWVARFMRPRPDDLMAQKLIAEFNAQQPRAAQKRRSILVSLSWGESNLPNGFICEGLEEVMRATSGRIRWLIRLHPNQVRGFAEHEFPRFKKYFAERLEGHAEWALATRSPLPVVLSNVDLHITWWSSTSIEAAQFGIMSAALNPRLRESGPRLAVQGYQPPKLTASVNISDYYEHYRKAGMIDFVPEGAAEIAAWIERNIERQKVPESYDECNRRYLELLDFLSEADRAP